MRGLKHSDNNSSFCAQNDRVRLPMILLEPVVLLINFIDLMSPPLAILLLTMKDQFKTFALKQLFSKSINAFPPFWGWGSEQ